MASDASQHKMSHTGLDLAGLIDLRSVATDRQSSLAVAADALASQVQLLDMLIMQHLGGSSIDSHLALIAAGRRLSALLEGEVPA
jgi:hypothetical protein